MMKRRSLHGSLSNITTILLFLCIVATIPHLPLVRCPPGLLGVLERQFYHVSQLCQEDQTPHHHHALPKKHIEKAE